MIRTSEELAAAGVGTQEVGSDPVSNTPPSLWYNFQRRQLEHGNHLAEQCLARRRSPKPDARETSRADAGKELNEVHAVQPLRGDAVVRSEADALSPRRSPFIKFRLVDMPAAA